MYTRKLPARNFLPQYVANLKDDKLAKCERIYTKHWSQCAFSPDTCGIRAYIYILAGSSEAIQLCITNNS
jgi:hypothetical protein